MKQWLPGDNPSDFVAISGYINAVLAAEIIARCGNDLTRENLLKQTTSLNGVELALLLPGIRLSNSPQDYDMYHELQLPQFDGKSWKPLGALISLKDDEQKSR